MSCETSDVFNGSGEVDEGPTLHFVQKLLAFLEDPTSGLEWNDAGDAICVRDPDEFAKNTLPLHFKHSNFASFVRQLHMYGFSKSAPLPPPARPVHEFRHRYLLRDDPSSARFIRRKNSSNAVMASVSVAGASNELKILSQQVRSVMERQAEMERALMQQHETLRRENGMLWQHIEISRRNQDALNNKLSQVISTFQHVANRFSISRPSKIAAPNGQQLIEYQDHVVDAEEGITTPLKRTREEVEDANTSSAATVLGQISQILRDGLNDASGMSFPVTIGGHSSALYPTMPPMITSPMQISSSRPAGASPASILACDQDHSVKLANDCQPQLSEVETDILKSPKEHASEIVGNSEFDFEKFQALQSQTQQLSDHLTDFELAWTPRSSADDGGHSLTFPGDYSENEGDWA